MGQYFKASNLVVNVHNTDPAASRQHRDRFRFPDSTHPNLARNARPHALTCSASHDLVHCKTQGKDKLHGHGCLNAQPSDLGLLTSNNTFIRIDSGTHSSYKRELIVAGWLALGYCFGARYPPARIVLSARLAKKTALANDTNGNNKKKKNKDPLEIDNLADILQDFKMVLVVRNDLKMGKGKIAAQCSHATLGLYKKLLHRAPKALNRWEMCAQPKVVVKIESEEDMLVLQERAKSLKLPTHITIDAGRTQIAPNSRTVMAILGPIEVVDDVTASTILEEYRCNVIFEDPFSEGP
ncbi:unnamed protein product [Prunus armeniaca]|uniref:peptidyl-tRNA hydrolase n=1 Tax=Prunus armeniaca TaxID=36596 RepID=A0A6J5U9H1_PRUAR|nr:unnamed protein product [Prunus armeniaca]